MPFPGAWLTSFSGTFASEKLHNYFLYRKYRPADSVLFNLVKTMFSIEVLKTEFTEGRKTEIRKNYSEFL